MNNYSTTITNEELNALPPVKFPGRIVVVDTVEAAADACIDLSRWPVIGFDTETRPNFKPGPMNRVALLQLSTPETCYLFRLCRMKLDKTILKLLENKNIMKIGVGLEGDLTALRKLRRFKADSLHDLQSMVGEWGIDDRSLRKLAGIVLGGRVSKAQRLSNWEAAELTEAQKNYAATDAWVCLQLYLKLTENRPCQSK